MSSLKEHVFFFFLSEIFVLYKALPLFQFLSWAISCDRFISLAQRGKTTGESCLLGQNLVIHCQSQAEITEQHLILWSSSCQETSCYRIISIFFPQTKSVASRGQNGLLYALLTFFYLNISSKCMTCKYMCIHCTRAKCITQLCSAT